MMDELKEMLDIARESLEIQKKTLDYIRTMDKSMRKLSVRIEEKLGQL